MSPLFKIAAEPKKEPKKADTKSMAVAIQGGLRRSFMLGEVSRNPRGLCSCAGSRHGQCNGWQRW